MFNGFADPSSGEFALYNIMGQQVMSRQLNVFNGEQVTIGTEGLSKGLCLFTFNNAQKVLTEKVMIY
jgi:hypothetical protein